MADASMKLAALFDLQGRRALVTGGNSGVGEAMARALPQGRYLHCPDGSHMAMYDDQAVYMDGLLAFLREVGAAAG